MKNKSIWLFSKVGQRAHIGELRRKGIIYCNAVEYFQGVSDGNLRGDPLENCTSFYHPDKSELMINGTKLHDIVGPIIIYNGADDVYQSTHLFCVTAIYDGLEIREDGKIFDPRVSEFGDTMLIIKPGPFIARVEKAVQKLKATGVEIELFKGLVEYVPAGENQHSMSVLRKADTYSWQQEFRLAIRVGNWHGGPFELKVGSIADISYVVPMKKFINKLDELEDGQAHLNFS